MKNRSNKSVLHLVLSVLVAVLILPLVAIGDARATTEGFAFAVSPMLEKILLNPGDEYSSSIKIYTLSDYTEDIKYNVKITGYYVDENYNNVFEECVERCEMSEWITINSPTEGRLSPGEEVTIEYTINVPKDAHGGGQYASIVVQAEPWKEFKNANDSENIEGITSTIKEEKRIAYTIYAEIAGDTIKQGEVIDVNVLSFLLSGNIKGLSSIKNTGNIHDVAKYTLQVFPLFSSEEIYTNEENPETHTILPDRTYYNETVWDNTPEIGVFYAIYTVEFEGVTTQVNRVIVKCPIWLLFIVMTAIMALIIYVIMRVKARKGAKNNKNSAK